MRYAVHIYLVVRGVLGERIDGRFFGLRRAMLNLLRDKLSGRKYELVDPNLPKSAVLVAVTDVFSDPEVLLARRARHLSRNPGEVCFPGGKWEEHDESLLVTALRESHEEIGLVPEWVDVIGGLRPMVARTGLNVVPYVGIIDADLHLQPTSDELESVFKVPLQYFMDQRNVTPFLYKFNDTELSFPSFVYEDYIIWGLTAYIIVDMVNSVYDAAIELPFK